MATTVELFNPLKPKLGQEAAKVLAESIPKAQDLATKDDIRRLEEAIKASAKGVEASLMRWMLTFFVPLWIGVYGTIVTLLLTR